MVACPVNQINVLAFMAKGLPRDIAERIIDFANELNDALKEDIGRSGSQMTFG